VDAVTPEFPQNFHNTSPEYFSTNFRVLLFLIYVNDVAQAVPKEQVKLLADDNSLFLSGICGRRMLYV